MDLSELYQQELKLLKESSKVFSVDYPAITEAMNRDIVDPDVDMILQGVSYLTAQFKKELDDQFPVALQALSQVLTPTLCSLFHRLVFCRLRQKLTSFHL